MTAAMPNATPRRAPDTKIVFVDLDTAQETDRVRISEHKQDVVVWFSARDFKVSSVKPKTQGAPPSAFHRGFPNHRFAKVVCSGAAVEDAVGHVYKVGFEFSNGDKLDPEVAVEI